MRESRGVFDGAHVIYGAVYDTDPKTGQLVCKFPGFVSRREYDARMAPKLASDRMIEGMSAAGRIAERPRQR